MDMLCLDLLSNWATVSILGVNSIQRSYSRESPRFKALDNLGYITVKWLLLDSKFFWKLNIKQKVQNAMVVYCSSSKMFVPQWTLRTKYNLTKNKYFVNYLFKIQRSACVSITGTLAPTPSLTKFPITNKK